MYRKLSDIISALNNNCFLLLYEMLILLTLSCSSTVNASHPKRNLRIGRVNNSITTIKSNTRTGTLVSASITTDIKRVLSEKYGVFIKCMTAEHHCSENYDKCFDTTNTNMQLELTSAKESCFREYFMNEGNLDKIKEQLYSMLSSDMLKLCTEDYSRQKLPNNGCQLMITNQSPGYMRYKECVRNACVSMDGGSGDFAGCFGSKQQDSLSQAKSECSKILSTYSNKISNDIKQVLSKEISELEQRACERMTGTYRNGKCNLYVGYTRERGMQKNTLGGRNFYALTENADFYTTDPNSLPTYPAGVPETSERFFGRFEMAKEVEVGESVFCSYTTFNLPKLFQYDSTYDAQYGSAMTGTANGIGGADMAMISGALGTLPAVMGLFSKKEGTEKLNEQVSGIDLAKDSLKRISPSIVGMATVSSDKGRKLRLGSEIKGVCVLQGGMSYNEGDTIVTKWQ